MHRIEIADIIENYLIEIEIWNESEFFHTISTDTSYHNLDTLRKIN